MDIGVMSLIVFLSGIFILIYGLFVAPTEEEEELLSSSMDMTNIDKALNALDMKLTDADKMIGELDKFSEYVTNEMQEKYKELTLLYQTIEEKENRVRFEEENARKEKEELEKEKLELEKREKERQDFENLKARQAASYGMYTKNMKAFYTGINDNVENKDIVLDNKKASKPQIAAKSSFDDVVYMYENGRNIEDIAKTLGKGKGEVRLMLDLMGKEE